MWLLLPSQSPQNSCKLGHFIRQNLDTNLNLYLCSCVPSSFQCPMFAAFFEETARGDEFMILEQEASELSRIKWTSLETPAVFECTLILTRDFTEIYLNPVPLSCYHNSIWNEILKKKKRVGRVLDRYFPSTWPVCFTPQHCIWTPDH